MAPGDKRKQAGAGSADKKRKKEEEEAADVADDLDSDELGELEEEDEEEIRDADAEGSEEEADGTAAASSMQQKRVWRPGIDEIQDGEQLDVEPGTYHMLHRGRVDWPCLSFDVLKDDLGANRSTYPMTAYVVAGTQAAQAGENRIYMMKWSNLYKTSKDGQEDEDDDDDESSEDSDEDHEAKLDVKACAHPGGVNRIRCMPQSGNIVATWSDTGKVHVWNLQGHRKALDKPSEKASLTQKPLFTCSDHKEEGFAMDWSPHETGRFLSGSNDGVVLLWEPVPGGWNVGADRPFKGHTASVEDVQWKRTGAGAKDVFATCSSDKSVRIWDVREKSRSKSAVHIEEAHTADVNVLSWSPCVGELLVSGSDDGGFKIWDTRNVGAGPMANFLWHRKPITSVDWHPTDETVLAVGCADNSVTLWDMAVEDDRANRDGDAPGASHFPAQLLFLHMGQTDIKELRWHPQIPSVCITTAASGFNIFKTCNI